MKKFNIEGFNNIQMAFESNSVKEIYIPFNAWSKDKLKHYDKRATSRTKKYGDTGDYFTVDGVRYVLLFVTKLPLWFITFHLYEIEGAESPYEFMRIWGEIHPQRGYRDFDMVYLHVFAKIVGEEDDSQNGN